MAFFAILTSAGLDALALALATETPLEITHVAVGDGGGFPIDPDQAMSALVNETARVAVNLIEVDPAVANKVRVEGLFPAATGGFTIREAGLFDSGGTLIAIASYPPTYKPTVSEGASVAEYIRIPIQYENVAQAVVLTVDNSTIMATRLYAHQLVGDGDGYTGVARPAPGGEPVGSAPGPGVPVEVVLPDVNPDIGLSAAEKEIADKVTWISDAVRFCPPILPSVALSALSAVTYDNFGGTITPSTALATGKNFVIKITLGGVRGVAKFKTSLDGGNTYGAEQTTAFSLTDATSGHTVQFSNSTFTLDGTAQYHSALTALAAFADAAGNIRWLIDRNGFPTHRLTTQQVDWFRGVRGTVTNSDDAPPGIFINLGTGCTATMQDASSDYPAPSLLLDSGTTNGQTALWNASMYGLYPSANVDCSVQWEAKLASSGASTHCDVGMSLSNNAAAIWDPSNLHGITIRKLYNEANWKLQTNDGGATPTTFDTGIAADTDWHRFKLEYHGADTALGVVVGGAVALCFIDDKLAGASSTNMPAAKLLWWNGQISRNGAVADQVTWGSASYVANRWLTVDPL